jgi:uncharacterized membrane protein
MPPARPTTPLTTDVLGLAALFLTSGTVHLVRPQVFEPIVPPWLPRRRALVLASGVAEIVCAVGLLAAPTRPTAGWASAGLLLAVFPANVQMSVTHGRRAARRRDAASAAAFAATVARLPLQWPMVRTALRAAGR